MIRRGVRRQLQRWILQRTTRTLPGAASRPSQRLLRFPRMQSRTMQYYGGGLLEDTPMHLAKVLRELTPGATMYFEACSGVDAGECHRVGGSPTVFFV